jgi:Fe-S oxidoreductase
MCPHCFNTIKNEYPYLGGNYEVLHYSQFVNELIDQKKIKFVASLDTSLTYHDSCYLGRHNGVFDEPREVANQIPGVELIEMSRCRENGFCCGAGGGQMWMDNKRGEKVNHLRTSQFLETNATTVAVSCPFCLQMFEEGIEAKGLKEKKKAVDLIELLNESMKVVQ